ncbi:MAG: aldose 1-epimerase family protein [Eubacteriales bacterium]|nr:aldose 1-epimerase family protein [Eubacteriales bacterium]
MLHTIENDRLTITVSDHGAELVSIYDKKNDREVLWQADPAFWKRHSPILFPNVGRHFGNHYRINEKEYPSGQHGFARDTEFSFSGNTGTSVAHTLCSSPETKENYPFDFELQITHVLEGNKVRVCWKVINTGKERMYFTIGGHPAFNVPVLADTEYSDYSLTFDGQESLDYLLIDMGSGTAVKDQVHKLELTDGTHALDEHMFDKDALIFDNWQIARAGIAMPDGTPYLELSCEGFPSFGIWSVPGAPFVCLEPWMGRCDDFQFKGTLEEKEYINTLDAGGIFEKSYSIQIF